MNSLESLPDEIIGSIVQFGVLPIDLNRTLADNLYSLDKWNILKTYFYTNRENIPESIFNRMFETTPELSDINKMFVLYSSSSEFQIEKFGRMIVLTYFNYKPLLDFLLTRDPEFISYILISKNKDLRIQYLPYIDANVEIIMNNVISNTPDAYPTLINFCIHGTLSFNDEIYDSIFNNIPNIVYPDDSTLNDHILNIIIGEIFYGMIYKPRNYATKFNLKNLYSKNLLPENYFEFFDSFKRFFLTRLEGIFLLWLFPDSRIVQYFLQKYPGELFELFTLDYDFESFKEDITEMFPIPDIETKLIEFDSFVLKYILRIFS